MSKETLDHPLTPSPESYQSPSDDELIADFSLGGLAEVQFPGTTQSARQVHDGEAGEIEVPVLPENLTNEISGSEPE